MNLENINTSVQFDLWIISAQKYSNLTESLNALAQIKTTGINGDYNFIRNGSLEKIQLRDKHRQTDFDFHLRKGCAHLAQIIQTAPDGSALLRVNFFNGEAIEIGEVNVGLDERINDTAKRNCYKFNSTDELAGLLNRKCQLYSDDTNSEGYFLIMAGAAADDDFDFTEEEDHRSEARKKEQALASPDNILQQFRCFSIYGDDLRIPVEKRKIDKDTDIFFATRLIAKQNKEPEGSLRLARGSLTFSDYTKTERIRALAAGSMSRLLQSKGSYLNKWDEYGAAEGELLLVRARAVGRLDYKSIEPTSTGIKFFFDSTLPPEISEGDQMELTSEEPFYIKKPDATWDEYIAYLEKEFFSRDEKSYAADQLKEPVFATIVRLDSNSLVLDLPALPSKGRFLILSVNGEKIQIKRRMQARKSILAGRSANPLLGLLIEEGGEIPDIQRSTRLKPLTPFVKNKIFKHDPTDAQIKAIDTALNTPDIALIQGPPGTGKTTVITAILERLNEEHDKTKSVRGEILVSGFQHDAVENIVARLSVNALPAVKFGQKSGRSKFTEDTAYRKIKNFCEQTAKGIRAKNPQIIQTEEQRKLFELFSLYSNSPSNNNAEKLLRLILDLPGNILTQELSNRTRHLLDALDAENASSLNSVPDTLRRIRSLRLHEAGFRDDGKEKAADLLESFEDVLDESDKRALKTAIVCQEVSDLDFLKDLKAVKLKLLDLFTPRPQFRIEKPRQDIIALIAEVSTQMDRHQSNGNKTNMILADFLHELEDNPEGVRKAIEDYNFVFAATTQQAEGKAIRLAKQGNGDKFLKYDTVVVDEAARTSPRDLLIPMAQAEKRIILVGDHRQLPHLIDEEVARALESDTDGDSPGLNQDFVKKSMFEYLFNRLKRLEEKDGIRRTVTLDAQYRMHPLLGEFVSNNFYYKPDGDQPFDERFRSPLPAKQFEHGLERTRGCAAAWIKIPNKDGKEEKLPSKSRRRIAEANAIAEMLKDWIDSDQGKNLSFGIITFYKAQKHAVYDALSKYGITKKSPDGIWQITKRYRFLEKKKDGKTKVEERFRIGTVDAFQGMEFDVVFLSMVRSQNMDNLPRYIKHANSYEKKQQLLFGHLMSENRLCVSMSRQKKLLIIVGDSEMAKTDIGREAVPALGNYFDLCSKEGVVL
jgi:DNA polymerase III delta prime subunit